MAGLLQRARAYFEAGGFRLLRYEPGFVELAGSGKDHEGERIFLWADAASSSANNYEALSGDDGDREAREAELLKSFAAEMRNCPCATGYYLVPRRLGLSQKFVSEASRMLAPNGGIRVPIEFFDAAYKVDGADGRRARSVLGDLLAVSAKMHRVAQPFFIRRGLGAKAREMVLGDLVEYLETAMMDPGQGPKLRIIDGSAGSGKTVAFNALVASLYREFIEAKKARKSRSRPIVFLPQHLRDGQTGYVDDVLAAVAATDMAEVASPAQCRWLLENGHSVWMFDGLDEFYAGGCDFFQFVDGVLSAPGSKAQLVICTRDSLLTSNAQMRDFVERRLAAGFGIEIYELAPWNKESWRQMAWLEIENGRSGAEGSDKVNRFVRTLESTKEISALAELPFYCSVLLERFRADGSLPKDEFEVLEMIVDRMVDREHGKDIFRWQDFIDVDVLTESLREEVAKINGPPERDGIDLRATIKDLLDDEGRDILFELIGGLAHTYRRSRGSPEMWKGLSVDDVCGLSGMRDVSVTFSRAVMKRLRTAIVQFAFFGPGRKAGSIDFTHQILADYLACRYALTLLQRAQDANALQSGLDGRPQANEPEAAVCRAIGPAEVVPGSMFHRFFAREIERDPQLKSFLQRIKDRNQLKDDSVLKFLQLVLPQPSLITRVLQMV